MIEMEGLRKIKNKVLLGEEEGYAGMEGWRFGKEMGEDWLALGWVAADCGDEFEWCLGGCYESGLLGLGWEVGFKGCGLGLVVLGLDADFCFDGEIIGFYLDLDDGVLWFIKFDWIVKILRWIDWCSLSWIEDYFEKLDSKAGC